MHINRRSVLNAGMTGFFGYALRNRTDRLFAASPTGHAKRCVVLWMNGGPSQLETFDPKPGTANGGPTRGISTAADGVRIAEHFPNVARQMGHLSIVRNLTSNEGEHLRGQYYLHTGFQFVPGFPRPAFGGVVSHQSPPQEFPLYVSIGSPGFGPAYLGPDHAPFSIENPAQSLSLMRGLQRRQERLGLVDQLGQRFDLAHPDAALRRRRAMLHKIEKVITTPFVGALDIDQESTATRSRYGEGPVADACLLARRLLEVGVNFVEVHVDGWDTHQDNFNRVASLCGSLDRPWAALMQDLDHSGLLGETIVLWMGEFGRTPTINGQNGRDHFPRVTPVVMGGSAVCGGLAIGQTDDSGTQIEGPTHRVADLFATLFSALGIDPAHEFTTSFGSPTSATEEGRVITQLI